MNKKFSSQQNVIPLIKQTTQMKTVKIFQVNYPDITGNFRLLQETASTATSG
jgi:hypothetical protein